MGLLSGSVILVKICQRVQPSRVAASSSAFGMVSIKPFITKKPVPEPDEKQMISASGMRLPSVMPSAFRMK